MVLVGKTIIEFVGSGQQQVVTHLSHRYHGFAIQMRLLDDKLTILYHCIAEVGGKINQPGAKGHVIDFLARSHHSILDLGHIHHFAV